MTLTPLSPILNWLRLSLRKALRKQKPVLLQAVMKVEVETQENTGDVIPATLAAIVVWSGI